MVKIFGQTNNDQCTLDFKSRVMREINSNTRRYEELLATMGTSKKPTGEFTSELRGTKSNTQSLIEKYIEKCGHIEIQGRKYANPNDAFEAEREEIRSSLTLPEEEGEEGEF